MGHVPFIDTGGVVRLISFIEGHQKSGGKVLLLELNADVKKRLLKNKEFARHVKKEFIFDDIQSALKFVDGQLLPLGK